MGVISTAVLVALWLIWTAQLKPITSRCWKSFTLCERWPYSVLQSSFFGSGDCHNFHLKGEFIYHHKDLSCKFFCFFSSECNKIKWFCSIRCTAMIFFAISDLLLAAPSHVHNLINLSTDIQIQPVLDPVLAEWLAMVKKYSSLWHHLWF